MIRLITLSNEIINSKIRETFTFGQQLAGQLSDEAISIRKIMLFGLLSTRKNICTIHILIYNQKNSDVLL
jgi:hypothetical protein